jgi:hypothetical protein
MNKKGSNVMNHPHPAGLAARVGMVHYIRTLQRLAVDDLATGRRVRRVV